MGKKIVVLTGSPRKNGNSFAMTKAFIEAAEKKGHEIIRFDCADMSFNGCHACETCYQTGKPCSFDDDFNKIAPFILESDGIVISTPVYWYSFPFQIKGVIDKLFSFFIGQKDLSGKQCALISCCGESKDILDCVRIPFERTANLLKWKPVGEVLIGNVYDVGEIKNTNGCIQAAALADKF